MKPKQQCALIAEVAYNAIGISSSGAWMWSNSPGVWHCCYPENNPIYDLNAMHQVIMSRTIEEQCAICEYLRVHILKFEAPTITATAPQLAEATLKVLNLWIE